MLCVVRGGRAPRHAVCCSALCVITCCAACQAVLWHDAGWHKVPTHPSLNSLPGPQTKGCLPDLTAPPPHPHLRSFLQFCKQNHAPHTAGPLHRLPSA